MAGAAHPNGGHPESRINTPIPERSLVTAVSDVVEAGHRVIVDRVELGLLEVRATLNGFCTGLLRTSALVIVASVLFATAWIALNGGLAHALATRFSPTHGLLAVAAINGLLAALFAVAAATGAPISASDERLRESEDVS